MKKVFLTYMLCLCTIAFGGIEGQYKVTGHDPYQNQEYAGTCMIKKDNNGVYEAEWMLENGAQFVGTGLVMENTVSFIFLGSEGSENQENKKMVGLQTYRIENATLRGKWVLGGASQVGEETMERIPEQR